MTKDEAALKWCPMARPAAMYTAGIVVSNRTEDGDEQVGSHCLADDCALWVKTGDSEGRCGLIRL